MNKQRMATWIVVALFIASACTLPTLFGPVISAEENVSTIAAKTWSMLELEMRLSATASFTPLPTSTPAPPTFPPTLTMTPSPTFSPFPSLTPFPSITPFPTSTTTPTSTITRTPTRISGSQATATSRSRTATAQPTPCNQAKLIAHLTIPNGTILPPNTVFTKVWRIKNTGDCTWDDDYAFVPIGGNAMGGSPTLLPQRVRPGQTVDIGVNLVAPALNGAYRGEWALRVGSELFGDTYRSGRERPFMVEIQVATISSGTVFHFAQNLCSGQWYGWNNRALPCPARSPDPYGYVNFFSTAVAEGISLLFPSIRTVTAQTSNGYIYGIFPGLPIQTGDRFQATLGCMDGKVLCNIRFSLFTQTYGNPMVLFQQWNETYDGTLTTVDASLNPLAGLTVSFIFRLDNLGVQEDASGLWVNPQIWRP